jgi:hypothetical protein
VAGIHGKAKLGCYSIVLNGGYEDDVDRGASFLYTGSGRHRNLWAVMVVVVVGGRTNEAS